MPKNLQKMVFTNNTKISTTQCYLNVSTYKNLTVSPNSQTLDNWNLTSVGETRVNSTEKSPIIFYNLMLPMDVTLASVYNKTHVEVLYGGRYGLSTTTWNSTTVTIDGQNVTLKVDALWDDGLGTIRKLHATESYLYNAANLLSTGYYYQNASQYTGSTLDYQTFSTLTMTLVTTPIQAPGGILGFPVEWVFAATAVAAFLLARRKMRGTR